MVVPSALFRICSFFVMDDPASPFGLALYKVQHALKYIPMINC
jgi:hypothetical protein